MVVLAQFEDQHDTVFKDLDEATSGRLSERLAEEHFTGKKGQQVAVDIRDSLQGRWILVLGAGKHEDYKPVHCRDLAAKATKAARARRLKKVAFVLPSHKDRTRACHFAALGAELGLYKFDKYKSSSEKPAKVSRFDILVDGRGKKLKAEKTKAYATEIKAAQAIAAAVYRARDLVNEPAGYMHPSRMAQVAQSIAKKNPQLTVKILGRKECEKLGMGMYLAVARGAHEEPKFIHMTYKPKKAGKKKLKKVALIGKGVMFDSGGYSIKPSAAMLDMKIDMAGSAAVISAMEAIAKLELHHEVHAIAACCENMVSGNAYKLGDVLNAMDGTTVEINNTDAEGRLTLGDAITYARKKVKPDEMFDFATLTGACMVALGPYTAGAMSKHPELMERWLQAADRAGELMWELPLQQELKSQLKSNIADMKNTGDRWGGAITAGLFLSHFAKDSTWLHVDLAGPASASAEQPAVAKGGTGFGVATIVDYLRS
jgi:leucyl aminopeptidase